MSVSEARSARPTGPSLWAEIGRGVALRGVITCLVVLVTLGIAVVWPYLSLYFSSARPVADALYTSSVYVGPGAAPVDAAAEGRIVGDRPVATVALAGGDALADEPLDTCRAVVRVHDTLLVQVIVDGEVEAGCEGDAVRYGAGTDPFGWDYVFWYRYEMATRLAKGDIPELTRQLALSYDAEVAGGRVIASTREFHAPPERFASAALLVGGIVVGTGLLFLLIRFGARRACLIYDKRRAWHDRRDALDGELGEIAMLMVDVDPVGSAARFDAIGAAAPEYQAVLADLKRAEPGDDLDAIAERVRRVRKMLAGGPAPAAGARA